MNKVEGMTEALGPLYPYAMNIALGLFVLLIAISLYRMNRDNDQFNLVDLLMENGRVSKISFIVMGSFGTHTWIMLYLTVHGAMSEGYMTIYLGWGIPLVAKMFAPQYVPAQPVGSPPKEEPK